MNSLKQFIPVLSSVFVNLSEHALYERQRVLVRTGLLKANPGRGPGSGVPLAPETVAMLMIAVLASDNLSEVGAATKILLGGVRIKSPKTRDFLPGVNNLHAALTRAMNSDDENDRIQRVIVNRTNPSARVYAYKDPSQPVLFVSSAKSGGNFSVESSFHGDTFVELRQIMSRSEPMTVAQQRLVQNRLAKLDLTREEGTK
ncbi:hypothetical protein [Bradyrhizobium yuanmingense]|uniref:hypothetical protein n=1 Tax=Bradyrhizobium yuanmingense TaxID=108015 RepID=UPI0023B936DC|nr:hypothetical protein [Bradyrhizobium yuanmingense]MDF0581254.1 hypothetical protein [Bradyrhizobium yuanmingense]